MINSTSIINIAKHVGDEILIPHWGKVAREIKQDGSAVSIVDKQASDYIISALKALTPNIPVISEEATEQENKTALTSSLRWVTDPLDGTSTYLNGPAQGKKAGFGVHIALIENGHPISGVCYFPAQQTLYYTGNDRKAYTQIGDDAPVLIAARQTSQNATLKAAVPWKDYKRPESVNGFDYEPVPAVGGEEICMVALGKADLMWQDRPDKQQPLEERDVFSHWDVAAAHAILKAAGAELYEIATGKIITYEAPSFHVPPCVAGHNNILRHIGFHPVGNGHKHAPDYTP